MLRAKDNVDIRPFRSHCLASSVEDCDDFVSRRVAGYVGKINCTINFKGATIAYSTACGSEFDYHFSLLFVRDNVDLSSFCDSEEIFDFFVLSLRGHQTTLLNHLRIPVGEVVNNIKYISASFGEGVSLKYVYDVIKDHNMTPQFVIEFFESVVLRKPLSDYTLTVLLGFGTHGHLLARMFRLHLILRDRKNYIGICLDEDNDNINYLYGRLYAVINQALSLSENKTDLHLRYSHFSVSPSLILDKIPAIIKGYIYTIPTLSSQIELKTLLNELVSKVKNKKSSTRLSYDEQALFAIAYQYQLEHFPTI